jgi:hypothetical protein
MRRDHLTIIISSEVLSSNRCPILVLKYFRPH